MFSSTEVYSPYEIDQLAIKVAGDSAYTRDDCIGTMTVERETKTVTKSCRGVVKKRKTRPTGNGTITLSMHIKLDLYRKINGMTNEGLQPGVYSFNNTVAMPEFSIAARVKNEDDDVLYKAFPRCKIEEINTLSIENGSEEVAEVELKMAYMPDENNIGEYEALADELTGEVLTSENWMTAFSTENAKATTESSSSSTTEDDTNGTEGYGY